MSIKSIIALADGSDLHSVMNIAVGLTSRLSARLEVLHIKADPYDAVPIGPEGLTGDIINDIVDAARTAIEERCALAKAEYDRTCAGSGQSVSWKEVTGRSAKMLSIASRFADLLVVAQPDDKSSNTLLDAVDTALFESGRPTVFVPAGASVNTASRIMIAWNGSTQASLAVTASLPLLQAAAQVDIVHAGDVDQEAPASELALYLAGHGVKCQVHAVDAGSREIGLTLITAAQRFDSNFIVMGAYGHSRLRERILGGATRSLLQNSLWPVLMMH